MPLVGCGRPLRLGQRRFWPNRRFGALQDDARNGRDSVAKLNARGHGRLAVGVPIQASLATSRRRITPYRRPAISSINAPIDRLTRSLLILFKAINVRQDQRDISGIGSPSTSGWLPNISANATPRLAHICPRPVATASAPFAITSVVAKAPKAPIGSSRSPVQCSLPEAGTRRRALPRMLCQPGQQ